MHRRCGIRIARGVRLVHEPEALRRTRHCVKENRSAGGVGGNDLCLSSDQRANSGFFAAAGSS
jgi:hypothetical protein